MKTLLLIISICLFCITGCALKQDVVTLNNQQIHLTKQIAQLNDRLKELEAQQTEKGQNLRDQNAGLRVAINKLRADLQLINGKLEENDHSLQLLKQDIDNLQNQGTTDLNRIDETATENTNRIIRIEQYLSLSPEDHKTNTENAGTKKEMTEDVLYKLAKDAFDKKDYAKAREKFKAILKKYPNSDNADNAQFWIGETYYREKWYEKALLEYKEVVEKYPKGNKVPAALLKIGISFQHIGDNAMARDFLNELIEKYPKSSEAKIAKKTLGGMK